MNNVKCKICSTEICVFAKLCWFEDGNAVHLSILPKYSHEISRRPVTDPKKLSNGAINEILCPKAHDLGNEMTREGTTWIGLSKDKVILTINGERVPSWKSPTHKSYKLPIRNKHTDQTTPKEVVKPPSPTILAQQTGIGLNFVESIRSLTASHPRSYQVELFLMSLTKNTLLYLPTGAGKTLVAAMLIHFMAKLNPAKKIVFLVNKVPLVFQQGEYIERQTGLKCLMTSGKHNNPEVARRVTKMEEYDVLVLTAGLFKNYLTDKVILWGNFSLAVLDEAHHTKSNDLYNQVMELYALEQHDYRPLVLGMTASPATGDDEFKTIQQLKELMTNLHAAQIIMPLITEQGIKSSWHNPEWRTVTTSLDEHNFEEDVNNYLLSLRTVACELLNLELDKDDLTSNSLKKLYYGHYKDEKLAKELITHMIEVSEAIETNQILGRSVVLHQLGIHFSKIKTAKLDLFKLIHSSLVSSNLWKQVQQLPLDEELSPRVQCLIKVLQEVGQNQPTLKDTKVLVFVRQRSTAQSLANMLNNSPTTAKFCASYLVGQTEMTWESQKEILDRFKDGKTHLIVATNVVEEGLDVAACNLVVCFDGVTSTKSLIQSRGRARSQHGRFVVITPDVSKQKSHLDRESIMVRCVKKLAATCSPELLQLVQRWEELYGSPLESRRSRVPLILENAADKMKSITELLEQMALKILPAPIPSSNTINLLTADVNIHVQVLAALYQNNIDAWIHMKVPPVDANDTLCQSIARGFLPSSFTFAEESVLSSQYVLTVDMDKHLITATTTARDMKIEFRGIDFHDFLLLDPTHAVHVCLKTPAKYYKKEAEQWMRLCDPTVGDCNAYRFSFAEERHALVFLNLAQSICTAKAYITNIKKDKPVQYLNTAEPLSWEVKYLLLCLISSSARRKYAATKALTAFLAQDEKRAVTFLRYLLQQVRSNPLIDIDAAITGYIPAIQKNLLHNYVETPRVVITPTRIIYLQPQPFKTNRVLRHYDPQRFIRVSFSEEHGGSMTETSGTWLQLLQAIVGNGIHLLGRKYTFLGSSSSQLKRGQCWFFEEDSKTSVESIHKWMQLLADDGTPQISNVATYYSRFGMSLASSDFITTVPEHRIIGLHKPMPDITDPSGDYCFSDGAGKISADLAKQVIQIQGYENQPCSFQYRLGGHKGVVTVDKAFKEGDLYFRNSSKKFEWRNQTELDILNISQYSPCYLNRQVITLLSTLGVEDKAFVNLQNDHMTKLASMLTDPKEALIQLKNCAKSLGVSFDVVSRKGMDILNEPLFQSLLNTIYFHQIKGIVNKSRIFVPQGRMLMGVMDETNSLEYGQVYIEYSSPWEEQRSTKPLNSKVVVCKNPCLHPGEVRLLTAVDCPKLRGLTDVIVFPAKGKRPHPNECSGSDLDGDCYWVCWDPSLFPPQTDEAPEYQSHEKPTQAKITQQDLQQFFVKTLVDSSRLGQIANENLARADYSPRGARDEICLWLAEQHFVEVDYAKTGIHGQFPSGEERMKMIPSWMGENKGKQTYRSEKVIGKMYELAKCLGSLKPSRQPESNIALSFLCEGYQQYENDAMEMKKQFDEDMMNLLNTYQVEEESEIITGLLNSLPEHFHKEKADIAATAQAEFEALIQRYRQLFFKEFGGEDHIREHAAQAQQKASAWYLAGSKPSGVPVFIQSFGWIASDILMTINAKKAVQEPFTTAEDNLTAEICKWFDQHRTQVIPFFTERLNVQEHLQDIMYNIPQFQNAQLLLFGSSSTFLFDWNSDVDLYVQVPSQPEDKEGQLKLLRSIFQHLQTAHDLEDLELISDAKVPIIRGTYQGYSFDLSASGTGPKKAERILRCIEQQPQLLPLLLVITQWGKASGILKKGRDSLLDASLLQFKVLDFCSQHQYLKPVESNSPKHLTSLMMEVRKLIHSVDKTKDPLPIGKILLEFLQHYSTVAIEPGFDLQGLFIQAYHGLVLTRSVKTFLDFFNTHKMIILRKNMVLHIQHSLDFVKQQLELTTGAILTIHKRPNGSAVIELSGDSHSVTTAEAELAKMTSYLHSLPPASKHIFLKGASMLLVENSRTEQDQLDFTLATKEMHLQHRFHPKYFMSLSSSDNNTDSILWNHRAFEKYQRRFMQQLEEIRQYNDQVQEGILKCNIRFGKIYLLNVPINYLMDKQQVTIAALENELQRNEKEAKLLVHDVPKIAKPKKEPSLLKPKKEEKKIQTQLFPKRTFYTCVDMDMKELKERVKKIFQQVEESYPPDKYTVSAHYGRDFKISLDHQWNVISLEERPVRCFISDLRSSNDKVPDMRVALTFNQQVHNTSSMFQLVHDAKFVLRSSDNNNTDPLIVDPSLANAVYMVRHHTKRIELRGFYQGINFCVELDEVVSYENSKGLSKFSTRNEMEVTLEAAEILYSNQQMDAIDAIWKLGKELRKSC